MPGAPDTTASVDVSVPPLLKWRLLEDRLALGPIADAEGIKTMSPEKLLTLAIMSMDLPMDPDWKPSDAGVEVRVKPATCKVTVSV